MLYLLVALWAAYVFWKGLTGRIGVEPIDTLLRAYGERGFQLLLAGLAISPLRKLTGVSLLHLRRAVGLSAFFLLFAHLLVFWLLDLRSLSRLGVDIAERPYITLGMAGFVLLIPLALTSSDWAIRKLGPKWGLLQRAVYPAAVLGWLHYDMQIRGFAIESVIYGLILLLLLLARLFKLPKVL